MKEDARPALGVAILIHRYLGMAFCLLFASWFISGIVMMYARMPHLTESIRVARLPDLDLSQLRLTPTEAWIRAGGGGDPARARVGMRSGRPAYFFLADERARWQTVHADDGTSPEPLDEAALRMSARAYASEEAGWRRPVGVLDEADQWTFSLASHRPLRLLSFADRAATEVYVSDGTGEVVLASTRNQRRLAYAGAVTHWLYATPLRRRPGLWRALVIGASAAGSLVCVAGLVVGLRQVSVRRRYRLPEGSSWSPHVGTMALHHRAGLAFGLVTLTWVGSGLLSMDPFQWSAPAISTGDLQRAFAGGSLELARFRLDPRAAVSPVPVGPGVKELELIRFRGDAYYLARDADGGTALYLADGPRARLQGFATLDLLAAAQSSVPAPLRETAWLTAYDAYYYDRGGALSLPVLRAKFGDRQETWLYLDPRRGAIARHYDARSRLNRWLYHGFHSFDLPFLYWRRPAWDVAVLALCAGGAVLSMTSVAMTARRIRANLTRRGMPASVSGVLSGSVGRATSAEVNFD